jgi:hypothetical protein
MCASWAWRAFAPVLSLAETDDGFSWRIFSIGLGEFGHSRHFSGQRLDEAP